MSGDRSTPTILVVGATGYVGGRLVPLLASRGYRVRAMGRSRASSTAGHGIVRSVGGDRVWFYAQPLWQLRGVVDRLAGGVGMRRGRRHPEQIGAGDVIGQRAAGASCLEV